jgi:hypothetical protein
MVAMIRERENPMRQSTEAVAWVVYTVITGRAGDTRVCEQGEWEQMIRLAPASYKLVRAGITNEGEAENLARKLSGFVPSGVTPKLKSRS